MVPQYKSVNFGKLSGPKRLNGLQMVQFECPRHWSFLIQKWPGESSWIHFQTIAHIERFTEIGWFFPCFESNRVLRCEWPILDDYAMIECIIYFFIQRGSKISVHAVINKYQYVSGSPNAPISSSRSHLPKTVIFLWKAPWRRSLFRAFITWHCSVSVQATRRTQFQERSTRECFMGFSDSSCADLWFCTFPRLRETVARTHNKEMPESQP